MRFPNGVSAPVQKSLGGVTPTLESEEGRHLFRGKDVEDIKELKREGLSIQAIGQITAFDRKTIRKYFFKPSGN